MTTIASGPAGLTTTKAPFIEQVRQAARKATGSISNSRTTSIPKQIMRRGGSCMRGCMTAGRSTPITASCRGSITSA